MHITGDEALIQVSINKVTCYVEGKNVNKPPKPLAEIQNHETIITKHAATVVFIVHWIVRNSVS